jgi:hypothetical protein
VDAPLLLTAASPIPRRANLIVLCPPKLTPAAPSLEASSRIDD